MNKKNMLTLYVILNCLAIALNVYRWNVSGKLIGFAFISPEAWSVFAFIILGMYILHRWSQRNEREYTIQEFFWSIIGTLIPYFSVFTIFMGASTGLDDYCVINDSAKKIVHVESYYTESHEEECTGSGDDKECHTVTKCDVYHSPTWTLYTKGGEEISISSQEYENIKHHFKTQEVQVASTQPFQCSGDGDEFEVIWSGSTETRIPCSYTQLYINYVTATNSLYKTTGQGDEKVISYPSIHTTPFGNIGLMRVIGDIPSSQWAKNVDNLLDHELTWLGKKRQCNILVYCTKKPQSFYGNIKEQWVGGKKNDIVVIIGGDVRKPNWIRIMCWSESSELEINLRNRLMNDVNCANPKEFVNTVVSEIDDPKHGFKRKQMEDYRYLLSEVHLQWWAWVLVIILTLAVVSPLIIHFFSNRD